MTADEVLDAMGLAIENQMACDDNTPTDLARAAIRAVTERGGLVVAKVPGKHPYPEYDQFDDLIHGYKSALAAVRASAVEVE